MIVPVTTGGNSGSSREMNGAAVLAYFAPLMAWLEEQNRGQQCGW